MQEVSTVELRDNVSDFFNQVAYSKSRLIVTRRGKSLCAVVSLEDYKKLIEMDVK